MTMEPALTAAHADFLAWNTSLAAAKQHAYGSIQWATHTAEAMRYRADGLQNLRNAGLASAEVVDRAKATARRVAKMVENMAATSGA